MCLRPQRDRQWNRQHREPDNGEARNGQKAVSQQAAQRAEMLTPERKAPLQQEQGNENGAKNRAADVIHQRNLRK